MAIEKKSLMNSRTAAKKAVIARKSVFAAAPQRGAVVAAPVKLANHAIKMTNKLTNSPVRLATKLTNSPVRLATKLTNSPVRLATKLTNAPVRLTNKLTNKLV